MRNLSGSGFRVKFSRAAREARASSGIQVHRPEVKITGVLGPFAQSLFVGKKHWPIPGKNERRG
jgi:hypothetical protein